MRELGHSPFQRGIGDGRSIQPLLPRFRQAQSQATPVVGILSPFDQPGTNQRVDRATDCGRATLHLCCDLVERSGLSLCDCGKKSAKLAVRFGRGGIAAQLLDEPGKAAGKRGGR